jgi:hypothetical protein
MLRCWVEWVRQAFISYIKNIVCRSTYPIHLSYYPISHHCCLLPPMPQDVLPPVELVEGPRKHILTEKAREAAEVPLKWVKPWPATVKASASASASTVSNPPVASIKSLLVTVAIPVSVADSVESVSKRICVCL